MNPPRTQSLDADFRRNPKTKFFCYFCQKDMSPDKPYRVVFIAEWDAVHPEDLAEAVGFDIMACPIGPDCAKLIGLEWSIPSDQAKNLETS